MTEVFAELEVDWQVGVRNGDTSQAEKLQQKKSMPEVLLITPESLHLLLAQKGSSTLFSSLKCIVADEWHELLGSKRGVLVELAISRIKGLQKAAIHYKVPHESLSLHPYFQVHPYHSIPNP